MKLPNSIKLPVKYLSAAYSNVTNSYKFYWFIVILENLKQGKDRMLVDELVIDMIGEVWYPINYFRLSFGQQDAFENAVKQIRQEMGCQKDIEKKELIKVLTHHKKNKEVKKLTSELSRWAPQRFIRPWFAQELRGMKDQKVDIAIVKCADRDYWNENNPSLYRFLNKKEIEINPLWKEYLLLHSEILKGFTYWHLIKYLQKSNPNVANISVKLFAPTKRQLSDAHRFWKLFITTQNHINCIYSNQALKATNFTIDHFLPWSFIGHDQLWNLIPTPKEVNSSKIDNLPSLDYLNSLIAIQHNAFHAVLPKLTARSKLMEDYSVLFNCTLREIKEMPFDVFKTQLQNTIKPQLQIAANMGFPENWKYQK